MLVEWPPLTTNTCKRSAISVRFGGGGVLGSCPHYLSSGSEIFFLKDFKRKEKDAKAPEKTLWEMLKGCVSFY